MDVSQRVAADDFGLGAHLNWQAAAAFSQDGTVDVLRPGPVLAAFTAQAVASAGTLSDDELTGALQGARRMASHAAYQQTVLIAEFAGRRRAQFEAALAAGRPAGCRLSDAVKLAQASGVTRSTGPRSRSLVSRIRTTPGTCPASTQFAPSPLKLALRQRASAVAASWIAPPSRALPGKNRPLPTVGRR